VTEIVLLWVAEGSPDDLLEGRGVLRYLLFEQWPSYQALTN